MLENSIYFSDHMRTKSSGVEKILGVTIDTNLNFKENILSLYQKANHKLYALLCISKYMTLNK